MFIKNTAEGWLALISTYDLELYTQKIGNYNSTNKVTLMKVAKLVRRHGMIKFLIKSINEQIQVRIKHFMLS